MTTWIARVFAFAFCINTATAADTTGLPEAFDAGWNGQQTCEVLYETAEVRAARCEFPPGVGHEKHFHYAHFGYVLEGGTLRITDADGTRTSQTVTGDSWSTNGFRVHKALNVGDTTTSYLIVEPKSGGEAQSSSAANPANP